MRDRLLASKPSRNIFREVPHTELAIGVLLEEASQLLMNLALAELHLL